MCKAPYLVLWECKERLQQFMTSKEVYSLLLKRTYFTMQTDVPGWSFWESEGEKTGKVSHCGGQEKTSHTVKAGRKFKAEDTCRQQVCLMKSPKQILVSLHLYVQGHSRGHPKVF